MIFTHIETIATKLHKYRWYCLTLTLAPVLAFVALFAYAASRHLPPPEFLRPRLGGRVLLIWVAWAWGLFLVSAWFHPLHGAFRTSMPQSAPFPVFVSTGVRVVALLILVLFIVGTPAIVLLAF